MKRISECLLDVTVASPSRASFRYQRELELRSVCNERPIQYLNYRMPVWIRILRTLPVFEFHRKKDVIHLTVKTTKGAVVFAFTICLYNISMHSVAAPWTMHSVAAPWTDVRHAYNSASRNLIFSQARTSNYYMTRSTC